MPEPLNALEALLARRSVPALQLRAPGPSPQQIELAMEAVLRAPDHGALRPWRFALVQGEARERLSELFVRRMQQRAPAAAPGKIEKARTMPLTVPLVIAVAARILNEHKVPEIEQLLATGAGVMNLLNAFHAQGFGAIWLTGDNGYDREIADALGFGAEERPLGFVYVGSTDGAAAGAPRLPARVALVRDWSG